MKRNSNPLADTKSQIHIDFVWLWLFLIHFIWVLYALNGKLRVEYCVLECRFNDIYDETDQNAGKKIHKAQLFAYLTENLDNPPIRMRSARNHFSLSRMRFSLKRYSTVSTKGKCDIMRTDCIDGVRYVHCRLYKCSFSSGTIAG